MENAFNTTEKDEVEKALPSRRVRARYDISSRTLARWVKSQKLAFPKPTVINGRNYFYERDLVTWELNQRARSN